MIAASTWCTRIYKVTHHLTSGEIQQNTNTYHLWFCAVLLNNSRFLSPFDECHGHWRKPIHWTNFPAHNFPLLIFFQASVVGVAQMRVFCVVTSCRFVRLFCLYTAPTLTWFNKREDGGSTFSRNNQNSFIILHVVIMHTTIDGTFAPHSRTNPNSCYPVIHL